MEDNLRKLLEIRNLTTIFKFDEKILTAVNNVNITINEGEIVGLVGESGCGKSMTSFSILKMVPHPGKIINGEIYYKEKDLLKLNEKDMIKIRGSGISLVCQDPLSSLNPSFNIYWHLNEVISAHKPHLNKKEKYEMMIASMTKVGIPDAKNKIFLYPHQFSGGMRQRIVITMALINGTKGSLIIADEPTTALDVTTQKDIFNLIEKLREEMGLTFIVISHDLYLISERCDRVYVMYSGEIVEEANSTDLFTNPLHPYTRGLIKSIPGFSSNVEKLDTIRGEVQDLVNLPKGCFFGNRCNMSENKCKEYRQELRELYPGRMVRCWKVLN